MCETNMADLWDTLGRSEDSWAENNNAGTVWMEDYGYGQMVALDGYCNELMYVLIPLGKRNR